MNLITKEIIMSIKELEIKTLSEYMAVITSLKT